MRSDGSLVTPVAESVEVARFVIFVISLVSYRTRGCHIGPFPISVCPIENDQGHGYIEGKACDHLVLKGYDNFRMQVHGQVEVVVVVVHNRKGCHDESDPYSME